MNMIFVWMELLT